MLDILAISPHPDDAELHCAGLLLNAREHGARIGVVDLTRGEMGGRGTPEQRALETEAATEVLGLDMRINLGLRDSCLSRETDLLQLLIDLIRRHQPKLITAPHWDDHHPDHAAAARTVREAAWLAGLIKYPGSGTAHRPEQVLYYLDRVQGEPSLVVDVSAVFEQKMRAVKCYAGQLNLNGDDGPVTTLSHPDYLDGLRARHLFFGNLIGVKYGEAYITRSPVPVANPMDLVFGRGGQV